MNYSDYSDPLTNQSSFTSASTECKKINSNMLDLQAQIIQQGKEIEDFIHLHGNKKGKSKSFIALQTLFKSFKTELSLNITLRQALINERENYKRSLNKLTKEIEGQNDFIKAVSHHYGCKFSSFEEILATIKNTTKEAKNAHLYAKQIKKITQETQESEAQSSIEMAHLHACIEQYEEENKQLQNRIGLIQCTNSVKDQSILKLNQQLKELQEKQNETEKKLAESEEKRNSCEELLQKAGNTLKTATIKAKQYKSERNKLAGYLQALDMIDQRQKELIEIMEERKQCMAVPMQPCVNYQRYRYEESESDDIFRCVKSLQNDINDLKQDIEKFRE